MRTLRWAAHATEFVLAIILLAVLGIWAIGQNLILLVWHPAMFWVEITLLTIISMIYIIKVVKLRREQKCLGLRQEAAGPEILTENDMVMISIPESGPWADDWDAPEDSTPTVSLPVRQVARVGLRADEVHRRSGTPH